VLERALRKTEQELAATQREAAQIPGLMKMVARLEGQVALATSDELEQVRESETDWRRRAEKAERFAQVVQQSWMAMRAALDSDGLPSGAYVEQALRMVSRHRPDLVAESGLDWAEGDDSDYMGLGIAKPGLSPNAKRAILRARGLR